MTKGSAIRLDKIIQGYNRTELLRITVEDCGVFGYVTFKNLSGRLLHGQVTFSHMTMKKEVYFMLNAGAKYNEEVDSIYLGEKCHCLNTVTDVELGITLEGSAKRRFFKKRGTKPFFNSESIWTVDEWEDQDTGKNTSHISTAYM